MKAIYLLFLTLSLFTHASSSEWIYEESVDEFSDKTVYEVMFLSPDATALARCTDDGLEIFFGVREYLGDSRNAVRIRFDKGPVFDYDWHLSSNGRAVVVRGDAFIDVLGGLSSSGMMLFEVTKYDGESFRYAYHTVGLKEKLEKLLKHCPVEDNRISESEYDQITAGLPESIKSSHSRTQGPRSVRCNKEMLSFLGYSLKDMSGRWTREYFEQLMVFISKESKNNESISGPYELASEKNPDFKEKCGMLYGYE